MDADPRGPSLGSGTGLALVLAVAGGGSGGSAGTTAPTSTATATAAECVKNEQGPGCLPLAPESQRIDRTTPVFSRSTAITNQLFPVAAVVQSLRLGTVDGELFRAEVTLLPGTKPAPWWSTSSTWTARPRPRLSPLVTASSPPAAAVGTWRRSPWPSIDAAGGPPPAELASLTAGARASFDAAGAGRWPPPRPRVDAIAAAWNRVETACRSCWPTR